MCGGGTWLPLAVVDVDVGTGREIHSRSERAHLSYPKRSLSTSSNWSLVWALEIITAVIKSICDYKNSLLLMLLRYLHFLP